MQRWRVTLRARVGGEGFRVCFVDAKTRSQAVKALKVWLKLYKVNTVEAYA